MLLEWWLQCCPVATYFSERCHAAMRRDLMSDGPATDFLGAVDRIVTRQVVAAHVARGGQDPTNSPSLALGGLQRQHCALIATGCEVASGRGLQ